MRIVNNWGELVRMTDRNYIKYLRAGAAGEEPDPNDYGKKIGVIAFHAIDATKNDYQDAVDAFPARKDHHK